MTRLSYEHIQWLKARGIEQSTADAYGLRSVRRKHAGQFHSGIGIPYIYDGKEETLKIRWLTGKVPWTHDDGGKRFWNQEAIAASENKDKPLFITEGEWDALIAIQLGYTRTISVPCGAKSKVELTPYLKNHLDSIRAIVLCGDNDEPGQNMNRDYARRIGQARCNLPVYPPDCKDITDVYRKYGPDHCFVMLEKVVHIPIAGLHTLSDYPDQKRPPLFSSGWRGLDPHCKFYRGEFCVVTGVPQAGKSRFVLDLLAALNRQHQHRAVIAPFEMPVVPYLRDLLREHYWQLHYDDLTDDQKGQADIWIGNWAYFLEQTPGEDTPEASLEWIIERAEDAVCRYGVDWLLIDPWNQVDHAKAKFETDADYQQRMFRALRKFRQAYGCGVIIVAHPTKAVIDKKGDIRAPTLYDISCSAHWYNSTDHGLIITRPDATSFETTITVAKSRFRETGIPGKTNLILDRGRFRDVSASKVHYSGMSDFDDVH